MKWFCLPYKTFQVSDASPGRNATEAAIGYYLEQPSAGEKAANKAVQFASGGASRGDGLSTVEPESLSAASRGPPSNSCSPKLGRAGLRLTNFGQGLQAFCLADSK